MTSSITKNIAIGVSILILLTLSTILITVVILTWSYKRRYAKQELYTDTLYSTLNRDSGVQVQPALYIQHDSAQFYDQIHLSPSTGQTEFIPKPQSENVNNLSYKSHPTHPKENSVTLSAESQTNPPQAIYAAIDKSKKKQVRKENTNHTAIEKKSLPVSPYIQKESSSTDKGAHAGGNDDPTMRSQKYLDNMCASDHKNQEKVSSEQESNPPHTVEELYTAVKKKPKGSVPVNEPILEDFCTAIMKKPKDSSPDGEAAPPIPSHTIEELYTAIQKKPKGSAMKDGEEIPPIPPHTVEGTY